MREGIELIGKFHRIKSQNNNQNNRKKFDYTDQLQCNCQAEDHHLTNLNNQWVVF